MEQAHPIPRRRIQRRLLAPLVTLAVLLALGGWILWYLTGSGSVVTSASGQTALNYARSYMVWQAGPSLKSTQEIRMGQLSQTLARSVPASVRSGVNVGDLISRYGPNRQVDLVILSGTYNSLPPDEGVEINSDVVVLVDPRTNRVMLLTA